MKYRVLSILIKLLIILISRTVRIKVYNRDAIDNLKKEGKRIIFSFYHQELFLLINYINHYKYNRVTILVSPSRDGDIAESVLRRFGFDVIRGSSRRGGLQGLIGIVKSLKNGNDVAFPVDGPLGPPRVVKPGIFIMAKRANAVIVPVASWAVPNVKLTSWDRTLIPVPFGRGCIVFGEPFIPNAPENEDTLINEFQTIQNHVSESARKICGQ